jgi:lipopolysaccharide/colanic/teichoic acid biosynthesis glycosyltransferase
MALVADSMKRLFDVVLSLVGLLLVAPILLLIAVLIKLASPGSVLYRGMRVGRFGKPFRILKFRTMVVDAERRGGSATAEDDPRVTSIGRLLRRYKLDELPQLGNVLLGDMSFVGPRPEVQKYIDRYTQEEKDILKLRPGITDWASIWNSNEAAVLEGSSDPEKAYEELILPTKIALQLKYLQDHSFGTDLKILFHTFAKLLREDWVPQELQSYEKVRLYRITASETSSIT